VVPLYAEEIVKLLAEARESTKEVVRMLHAKQTTMVLELPRMEQDGEALVNDSERLEKLLTQADELPVDCMATLYKWWTIANRALAIHAIFEHFRERKRKRKKLRLKKMWDDVAATVEDHPYTYSHASTYDRLGKFLLEFPGFLYQTLWWSHVDWTKTFGADGKRGKNLSRCCER